MAAVALVQVHDHRRQALERARARERAGVERAARGEPLGELERQRLRVGVVAADEGVLVGRLVAAEASRRRASAARRATGPSSSAWIALRERRRVLGGEDAVRGEAKLGRDREHRRRADRAREARARCRARRRPSSRGRRDRPARTASSFVAPSTPSSCAAAAARCRVARADHDLVPRRREAASRSAMPNGPVPPTIATRTRPPARVSARRRADVAVAHERAGRRRARPAPRRERRPRR